MKLNLLIPTLLLLTSSVVQAASDVSYRFILEEYSESRSGGYPRDLTILSTDDEEQKGTITQKMERDKCLRNGAKNVIQQVLSQARFSELQELLKKNLNRELRIDITHRTTHNIKTQLTQFTYEVIVVSFDPNNGQNKVETVVSRETKNSQCDLSESVISEQKAAHRIESQIELIFDRHYSDIMKRKKEAADAAI